MAVVGAGCLPLATFSVHDSARAHAPTPLLAAAAFLGHDVDAVLFVELRKLQTNSDYLISHANDQFAIE